MRALFVTLWRAKYFHDTGQRLYQDFVKEWLKPERKIEIFAQLIPSGLQNRLQIAIIDHNEKRNHK